MLRGIAQGRICYQTNLSYPLVMIAHETEVGCHCAKTFPSRKCCSLNDQAGKNSRGLNVWVDGARELDKVTSLERGLWSHIQNGVRRIEAEFNHALRFPYWSRLTLKFTRPCATVKRRRGAGCNAMPVGDASCQLLLWLLQQPHRLLSVVSLPWRRLFFHSLHPRGLQ